MKKINIFLSYILIIIALFSSLIYLMNYSNLGFVFYLGNFATIVISSLFLSIVISFILINLYFFAYLKILKPIVNNIFIIPEHIYAITSLIIIRQNTKNIIIIFSIINSLLLFKKYIEKIEELNKKDFINHLKLIDLNHLKLFSNHIFPILKTILIFSLITRIIFMFDMYIILYVLNIGKMNINIIYFFMIYILFKYLISFKNINSTYI